MEGDHKLSRIELVDIFKRNSLFSKEAYLEQFEGIITKIAEKSY